VADRAADRNGGGPRGRRLRRWLGLGRLSLGRLVSQLRRLPRQTAVTVSLVALTIALLVVVTGIATGLAADSTADDEADIRVVPEGAERSRPSSTSRARGSATPTRARRRSSAATTSRTRRRSSRKPSGFERRGATNPKPCSRWASFRRTNRPRSRASRPPRSSRGPHYANRSYDGPRTGEIVLTDAAADGIDAAAGDDLEVRGRCSKRRTGPSRTIGLRRTP